MSPPSGAAASGSSAGDAGNDAAYFQEYSDLSVHELMLKDAARTSAYRDAVRTNAHLFQGKVVMDVGCGVGILALFCARAGAKSVYAVEASEVALLAKAVVAKNGLDDVVTVVHRRVEDIDDLEDLRVDVIISEWMGFYLLHESMLDTVIHARDKWLKPDGVVFPSVAYLHLAPVNMDAHFRETVDSWSDFHDLDLSPVGDVVRARDLAKPAVLDVAEHQLLAEPRTLASFDLKSVTREEASSVFQKLTFDVELSSSSPSSSRAFHGFVCWFECVFAGAASSNPVTLSTRPGAPSTHWKQTVFFLPQPARVRHDDVVSCYATLTQSRENPRHYDVCIDLCREEEEEEDGDDDEIDLEGKDHPVPCDCGATRCQLVRAVLERYAQEESERAEAEAELRQ